MTSSPRRRLVWSASAFAVCRVCLVVCTAVLSGPVVAAPAEDAIGRAKADPAVGLTLDELKANYEIVEVGCADRGMAHEAVVRPGLVVGDDEQDIGPLRSGRGRSLEEGGQEPAQKEEHRNRGPEVLPN